MADPNLTTLGEMIKAFYHDNHRDSALDEQKILDSWNDIVGDFIAAHTLKKTIKNGIFYVKVDADSLRNELIYSKSMLLKKLNSKAEDEILKDIVIN
jgi:predicted nucleic acid-binding Zn ribbon protein